MQDAVAFYWTLPVRWASHDRLPQNPDEAARLSRTISYQVQLVRKYAKDGTIRLLDETALMEKESDRASEVTRVAVKALLARQQGKKIMLLHADFREMGWRTNYFIDKAADGFPNVELLPVACVPLAVKGQMFEPLNHFKTWRGIDQAKRRFFRRRAAQAAAEAAAQTSQKTLETLAAELNAKGYRTATGKAFDKDNLKKAIQTHRQRNRADGNSA